MLPFICSGGKLLLSLSLSLNATGSQNHARKKKKKRRIVLLSGEVWLLLFDCFCLFVFFLSFDCFVFSLFQTAGSASFIRLIDDGQCGYMENRICLNSRILLRLLILMRQDEKDGTVVSNTASAVIMHLFWLGQKSLVWNPCETDSECKVGERLSHAVERGSSVLCYKDSPWVKEVLKCYCLQFSNGTRGPCELNIFLHPHLSLKPIVGWMWARSPLSAGL